MKSKYVKIDGKEQVAVVFELTAYVVMPKNGKRYKTYIQTDGLDIGNIQIAKSIESIATLSGAKSTKVKSTKAKSTKAKTTKAKPTRVKSTKSKSTKSKSTKSKSTKSKSTKAKSKKVNNS